MNRSALRWRALHGILRGATDHSKSSFGRPNFGAISLLAYKLTSGFVVVLALVAGLSRPSGAQWEENGNRLCVSEGYQLGSQVLSDGTGGGMVVWEDGRSGPNDIYCTRFTREGLIHPSWPAAGLPLCVAPGQQSRAVMVSDGAGGAITAWSDGRSGADIYAQRFSSAGQLATGWPTNGMAVCIGTVGGLPAIAGDGQHGAFVAWNDNRVSGINHDIYAQRIIPTAEVPASWPGNGFGVNTSPVPGFKPKLLSDGNAGAFVVWESFVGSDIFAQRITGVGSFATGWPPEGLVLSAALGNQRNAVLAPDGCGGVIVAWEDGRNDSGDIYAQRFTSDGVIAPEWTTDGFPVSVAAVGQIRPAIVAIADGALIVWSDSRNGVDSDIYAQRITTAGAIASGWPLNGIPVCVSPGNQTGAVVVPDDEGGVIIAWEDTRSDDGDIYAQRIAANGTVSPGWTPGGVALCKSPGAQRRSAIAPDGQGGALVTWTDSRALESAIYAGRVTAAGLTGPEIAIEPAPSSLEFFGIQPNPMQDQGSLRFRLPSSARVSADILDMGGRRLTTVIDAETFGSGDQVVQWGGMSGTGVRLPPGVYFVRMTTMYGTLTTRVVLLQ